MDIFTHTLSGIAAASAVAGFSCRSLKNKFLMICCGAAGAMLPDLDAVTRWPAFDTVIGKALGLSQTGRDIYYGHHWYSHHHFMHSITAGAIFTRQRRGRCPAGSYNNGFRSVACLIERHTISCSGIHIDTQLPLRYIF
jgi:hypothetical protein